MKSGSMRILYLSQYFPPEAGATQTRAYEMARNLLRLGHAVTMIAEVPNHPSGIIPPAYRGKLVERSQLEGIEVIRVWVKASPIKSFRNRMLFYLSYMAGASLAGLLLAHGRYDLIYASSPPLFVGAAALALSALRRIPMLFEVRDLWPESAVALGELSNPRAVAWATRLEEACYRRARVIIVVTEGIRQRLLQRGLVGDKVHLIPNGANVDLFHFDPGARRRVRQELSLGEKFVAIYAGIHGVAQGLETMVEAARRLQADSQIHFLLVGDGPKKAELVELVRQYKLANVTLLDEQPRPAIPALLSAADAAVIPLRKLEIFKGALPSKMFDSWACERPVLLSVDGEARQVMEAARGGVFVEPEDPQALAQAILELRRQPELRQQMGNRGRSFTERHYSRRAQAEQLAGIMQAVLKSENN
jgi:colanic acid biosynthesis glycosyl transferase WcaI